MALLCMPSVCMRTNLYILWKQLDLTRSVLNLSNEQIEMKLTHEQEKKKKIWNDWPYKCDEL